MSKEPNIETIVSEVADWTLEKVINDKTVQKCSDDAFSDSVLIFQYFFTAKLWEHCEKNNIPQRQRELMAENAGKYLHHHIMTFTGIDLHKSFKN